MKRCESKRPRAWVVSVLLAVVLGWAAGAGAAEPGGGAQAEGIKVHGHWTIDVRNPDGTLASHHEIENSLDRNAGTRFLVELLMRVRSNPTWRIELPGASTSGGPCSGTPEYSSCYIVETLSPMGPSPDTARNLIVTGQGNTLGEETLVLSGSTTAQNDSIIAAVYSYAVFPAGTGIGWSRFTERILSPAITVRQGQVIQVKAVISFS